MQLTQEQEKMLLRISALLAKSEDLSPFIFQMQIQPSSQQLSPILALPTHKEVLEILLTQAPLIPKAAVQQIKQIYGEIENTKTEVLVPNPTITSQIF